MNSINKEEITQNFQNEIQNKLLNKSFDVTGDYVIKVSNIIAEAFVLCVFDIYKEKYDSFDIKPVKLDNILLFKIQLVEGIQFVDVLLSISKNKDELIITNVLINIKEL